MNTFDQRPPLDVANHRDAWLDYLLQLHYGLLSDEESASLHEEIVADPELGTLWMHAQQTAGQFSDAAQLHVAKSELPDWTALDLVGLEAKTVRRSPSLAWLVAVAACLGWMVIAGWQWSGFPRGPAGRLVITALEQGPTADDASKARCVEVQTHLSSYEGFRIAPAMISFRVFNRGAVLFQGSLETDSQGEVTIQLPPELIVPAKSKLQIKASAGDEVETTTDSFIEVPLPPTPCITHVSADRASYVAGEKIYVRSLTLQRWNHHPVDRTAVRFTLRYRDHDGEHSQTTTGISKLGVGNAAFVAPAGADGGKAQLIVESLEGLFPKAKLPVRVLPVQPTELQKVVEFDQPFYFPGDRAKLRVKLLDAKSRPVAGIETSLAIHVGKRRVHRSQKRSDQDGVIPFLFAVPVPTKNQETFAVLRFQVGQSYETRRLELPVLNSPPQIEVIPESGELISGVPNRVYFSVADAVLHGLSCETELLDGDGNRIAVTKTDQRGFGSFRLDANCQAGQSLRVFAGTHFETRQPLPGFQEQGVAIDSGSSVYGATEPLEFLLRAKHLRRYMVRAICRGRLVGQTEVVPDHEGKNFAHGEDHVRVTLPLAPDAFGVIELVVHEQINQSIGRPVAERLVFRRRARQLHLTVQKVPGDGSGEELLIFSRDEAGRPVSSILGVNVVDRLAARGFPSSARQSLTTHAMVACEVAVPEAIRDEDSLLAETSESEAALDRVLGAQGWRRFASPHLTHLKTTKFRQRLIELLSVDGAAFVDQRRVSNQAMIQQQWVDYQRLRSRHLRTLLLWLLGWTLLVLGGWVVWSRLLGRSSRSSFSKVVSMLLFGLLVAGCGQQANVVIRPPEHERAGSRQAASVPRATNPPSPSQQAVSDASETLEVLRLLLNERALENQQFVSVEMTRAHLVHLMSVRGLSPAEMVDELIEELAFPVDPWEPNSSLVTRVWKPLMLVDTTGVARIKVPADRDLIVQVDAHTNDGRIGSVETIITGR